jgi:hypothetical protein
VIQPGAISPNQQPNGQIDGFNETRINYHGHMLMIDTNYGTPHPTTRVRDEVATLLRSISTP